jgi:hypothetical protein
MAVCSKAQAQAQCSGVGYGLKRQVQLQQLKQCALHEWQQLLSNK